MTKHEPGVPLEGADDPRRSPHPASPLPVVLDARLEAVAEAVERLAAGGVHCDVGTDHARLPRRLLERRVVRHVIATENNPTPFRHACEALRGSTADCRYGDGLSTVRPGELDSVSACGMGALRILGVLARHPRCIPDAIVLQPNDDAAPLREWALENGFHLDDERRVRGRWRYEIVAFVRRPGTDPAYEGVPLDLATRFGPLLLRRRDPLLLEELLQRRTHLRGNGHRLEEYERIEAAIAWFGA